MRKGGFPLTSIRMILCRACVKVSTLRYRSTQDGPKKIEKSVKVNLIIIPDQSRLTVFNKKLN